MDNSGARGTERETERRRKKRERERGKEEEGWLYCNWEKHQRPRLKTSRGREAER